MEVKSLFVARVFFVITVVLYPLVWILMFCFFPVGGGEALQNSVSAAALAYGEDYLLSDTVALGSKTYYLYLSHSGADKVLVTAEKAPIISRYRIDALEMGQSSGVSGGGLSVMIVGDKLKAESSDASDYINIRSFLIPALGLLWIYWTRETYGWIKRIKSA